MENQDPNTYSDAKPPSTKKQEKRNRSNPSQIKVNKNTFREGDWICMRCNNLNFSFRNQCNRCNIQMKKDNVQQIFSYSLPQQNFAQNWPGQTQPTEQVHQQMYANCEAFLNAITPQKLFPKKVSQDSESTDYSAENNLSDEKKSTPYDYDDFPSISPILKRIQTKDKRNDMAKFEEDKFLSENKVDQNQILLFNVKKVNQLLEPVRTHNNRLPYCEVDTKGFDELKRSIDNFQFNEAQQETTTNN